MILSKIESGFKFDYKFNSIADLEEKLNNKIYDSKEKTKSNDKIIISFKADEKYKRLSLLIILSPILISIFDNGKTELEYLKNNLNISNFKYGLYETFFENFDLEQYFSFYDNHPKNEDIIMDKNLNIYFSINHMQDKYILALTSMVESLILNESQMQALLAYFAKIRNDIVINGRRSILANGIQAFYLSKYVVIWALNLFKIIEDNNIENYKYIKPIFELTNNLKTPGIEKLG